MRINSEILNEGKVLTISFRNDNLDASNTKQFKDAVQPLLEGHQTIMFDMSGLNFVDSSGLGSLLSCLRTMNNKDGQLILYAMNKPVQALFELVRMHRIFSIYTTKEEALASL
jgi:anti-sigma B factor antagonist